jgi:cobalt/nickel transport system permease protein
MSLGHGRGLTGVAEVAAGDTPVHRLDPRVKIVGLIGVVVVTVTTPEGAWPAFAAYGAVLVVLAAAARLPVTFVLRRMVIEIPFLITAVVLVLVRGPIAGGTLAARVTLSVLAVVVLSSTTPFPTLLRGFQGLRAPALIVTIVAFMWRYLHVIGEEVRRMRIAREARGWRPRNLWQSRETIGGTIAALFIRSLERGERVYLAMTSRAYTGGVPAGLAGPVALRTADLLFVAGMAAFVTTARVLLS